MVVPLIRAQSTSLIFMRDLNPRFDVEGQPHVMLTQAASAVRKRDLRRKVASMEAFHDQIAKALDILFLGF